MQYSTRRGFPRSQVEISRQILKIENLFQKKRRKKTPTSTTTCLSAPKLAKFGGDHVSSLASNLGRYSTQGHMLLCVCKPYSMSSQGSFPSRRICITL